MAQGTSKPRVDGWLSAQNAETCARMRRVFHRQTAQAADSRRSARRWTATLRPRQRRCVVLLRTSECLGDHWAGVIGSHARLPAGRTGRMCSAQRSTRAHHLDLDSAVRLQAGEQLGGRCRPPAVAWFGHWRGLVLARGRNPGAVDSGRHEIGLDCIGSSHRQALEPDARRVRFWPIPRVRRPRSKDGSRCTAVVRLNTVE